MCNMHKNGFVTVLLWSAGVGVVMCNVLNNGFVTGLLWSAGTGVVMCNALNNGFVTGWFKRLTLLCFQYVPQYNKGSLFVGRAFLCCGTPII